MNDADFKRIQKLITPLATKADIDESRKDNRDLKESVQAFSVSVDGLAKTISDLTEEYAAIKLEQNRHGAWISKAAPKIRVPFSR